MKVLVGANFVFACIALVLAGVHLASTIVLRYILPPGEQFVSPLFVAVGVLSFLLAPLICMASFGASILLLLVNTEDRSSVGWASLIIVSVAILIFIGCGITGNMG